MSRQFPGSRQQSLARNNLVYGAILLRLRRAQFLAAEQEVTAANLADDFGPHDMHTVAGHDAECGVRFILKVGTLGGDDDVAQQGIFGMRGGRAIDGRYHRHLYIEDVFEDLDTLAQDLVVSRRSEEIETFGRELGAKFVARAGQDDDVIVAVIADVAERLNQRFVHVAVEHQRTASRMQGDLQYSVFALHPDVFVFVAVTVKHAHAPCGHPSLFVADLRSFSATQPAQVETGSTHRARDDGTAGHSRR